MDEGADLFPVLKALLEDSELVPYIATKIQISPLIDCETSYMLDCFGIFRVSLSANILQVGNISDEQPSTALLSGVKLERLKLLSVVMDTDAVNAILFQLRCYFALT